jgi:hypothetical protein
MNSLLARSARLVPALWLAVACASGSGGGVGGGLTASGQIVASGPRASIATAPKSEWIQMFNGRDLKDWDIKFAKHPLGENYNNTFRVEDGLLKVRYDKWTAFNGEFGHIFYKQPFNYYLVAAEYRFNGVQVPGAGPGLAWAIRNNGIMANGQSAQSMGLNQDFPISLEVQLLGGLGDGKKRSTANLCTPGTNVHFGDSLITRHCINSTSRTYDGDQWVLSETLVLGDSIVKHIINHDTVLVYTHPRQAGGVVTGFDPRQLVEGKLLSTGFIALQAEGHPVDFRNVRLLDLEGCMDPRASNYKRYYVKSNPAACR